MSKFDELYKQLSSEITTEALPALAAPVLGAIGRGVVSGAAGAIAGQAVKKILNKNKNEDEDETTDENVQMQQPQQNTATGVQPKSVTGNQTQVDPKIIQELIAAKNEQQVQMALQKLQAIQQTQQKTGNQQPVV